MIWVILLPYLRVLLNLIFEPAGMAERNVKQQHAARSQLDQDLKSVSAVSSPRRG